MLSLVAGPSGDTASFESKFEEVYFEGIPKARDVKALKNIDFESIPKARKVIVWAFLKYLKERYQLNFKVRVTGILIEEERLLLVKQIVDDSRSWSLPGGTLEIGETLEECIVREMKEETGLNVEIEKLLYLCDRIDNERHVVHITFKLKKVGGMLELGYEPEDFANPITGIEMVPINELDRYGFSEKFIYLLKNGFPSNGNYMGLIKNIGL
jgi:ADP-ribose pyrophosphatase YjhB (NUDIX family)